MNLPSSTSGHQVSPSALAPPILRSQKKRQHPKKRTRSEQGEKFLKANKGTHHAFSPSITPYYQSAGTPQRTNHPVYVYVPWATGTHEHYGSARTAPTSPALRAKSPSCSSGNG